MLLVAHPDLIMQAAQVEQVALEVQVLLRLLEVQAKEEAQAVAAQLL
jgi:hypothetical protein